MESEIYIIDILSVLRKYWLFITCILLISVTATVVKDLRAPKEYLATATVLQVEGVEPNSLVNALVGLNYGDVGMAFGGSNNRIEVVVKSRLLAMEVLEDLDLLKIIYKKNWDENKQKWKNNFSPSLEVAAAYLSAKLRVKSDPGVLRISFSAFDPQIAAVVANAYVRQLNEFSMKNSFKISFQMLDHAVPPLSPYAPNMKRDVLLAAMASLFISSFFAFVLSFIQGGIKKSELKGEMHK